MPREVWAIRVDEPDELLLCGFTSDEACLKYAHEAVVAHAAAHQLVAKGRPAPLVPAMQIRATGLEMKPSAINWFPAIEHMMREPRLRPPGPTPPVWDYRTEAARVIKGRKQRGKRRADPWSRPIAQALAERLHWPRP